MNIIHVSDSHEIFTGLCNICHEQVVYNSETGSEHISSFTHRNPNSKCLGVSFINEDKQEPLLQTKVTTNWLQKWDDICKDYNIENVCFYESLVSPHNHMTKNMDSKIRLIFNATDRRLFEYNGFSIEDNKVFFFQDKFNSQFCSESVFFHCNDGVIRKACCDSVVKLKLPDLEEICVRVLKDVSLRDDGHEIILDLQSRWGFGAGNEVCQIIHPVKVMSITGRDIFDTIHRNLFYKFPVNPITIYNAPPGAGKTTAIKNAVRRWKKKKVLIIVYNKANQETLMEELKDCVFCTVKTLDALCMAATTNRFGGELADDTFDEDATDKTFVKKNFPKWDVRDKIKHGGGRMSSSIITHRLTHPKAACTICKVHKRLSMVKSSDGVDPGWDASLNTHPIHNIVKNITTFASRRYVCDRDHKLVKLFEQYDVVLVDEMQDLSSEQEMRLIQQASCPIVMVGDFQQTINDFRHSVNTIACDHYLPCSLPPEPKSIDISHVVEWYSTFRLDPLSVQWLEDMTGTRMKSNRRPSDISSISWSSVIPYKTHTLILCRKNESVISEAIRYSRTGNIRVIGGVRIALLLKTAASDKSQTGLMSQLADKLKSENTLSEVVNMLQESDISLNALRAGGVLAIGTVHQLKGFEYENVAIHYDVLQCAAKEREAKLIPREYTEQNCLFVALTRHKKSLTILYDINSPKLSGMQTDLPSPDIFKIQKNRIFS